MNAQLMWGGWGGEWDWGRILPTDTFVFPYSKRFLNTSSHLHITVPCLIIFKPSPCCYHACHHFDVTVMHDFWGIVCRPWQEKCCVIGLTHWSRVTHICVGNLTIIGSDNGLSPSRRQAIIWTSAGVWLIGILETDFSEILIEIHTFSFKKMHLKMSSEKWRPFSASMC